MPNTKYKIRKNSRPISEELDISDSDSVTNLIKHQKELQKELKTTSNPETKDQIQQDILELGKIIKRKQSTK